MKKIAYSKSALKTLVKMQPARAQAIRAAIHRFAAGEAVDAKPLSGRDETRIRVGDFRALVWEDVDTIYVERIGSRGEIYKR